MPGTPDAGASRAAAPREARGPARPSTLPEAEKVRPSAGSVLAVRYKAFALGLKGASRARLSESGAWVALMVPGHGLRIFCIPLRVYLRVKVESVRTFEWVAPTPVPRPRGTAATAQAKPVPEEQTLAVVGREGCLTLVSLSARAKGRTSSPGRAKAACDYGVSTVLRKFEPDALHGALVALAGASAPRTTRGWTALGVHCEPETVTLACLDPFSLLQFTWNGSDLTPRRCMLPCSGPGVNADGFIFAPRDWDGSGWWADAEARDEADLKLSEMKRSSSGGEKRIFAVQSVAVARSRVCGVCSGLGSVLIWDWTGHLIARISKSDIATAISRASLAADTPTQTSPPYHLGLGQVAVSPDGRFAAVTHRAGCLLWIDLNLFAAADRRAELLSTAEIFTSGGGDSDDDLEDALLVSFQSAKSANGPTYQHQQRHWWRTRGESPSGPDAVQATWLLTRSDGRCSAGNGGVWFTPTTACIWDSKLGQVHVVFPPQISPAQTELSHGVSASQIIGPACPRALALRGPTQKSSHQAPHIIAENGLFMLVLGQTPTTVLDNVSKFTKLTSTGNGDNAKGGEKKAESHSETAAVASTHRPSSLASARTGMLPLRLARRTAVRETFRGRAVVGRVTVESLCRLNGWNLHRARIRVLERGLALRDLRAVQKALVELQRPDKDHPWQELEGCSLLMNHVSDTVERRSAFSDRYFNHLLAIGVGYTSYLIKRHSQELLDDHGDSAGGGGERALSRLITNAIFRRLRDVKPVEGVIAAAAPTPAIHGAAAAASGPPLVDLILHLSGILDRLRPLQAEILSLSSSDGGGGVGSVEGAVPALRQQHHVATPSKPKPPRRSRGTTAAPLLGLRALRQGAGGTTAAMGQPSPSPNPKHASNAASEPWVAGALAWHALKTEVDAAVKDAVLTGRVSAAVAHLWAIGFGRPALASGPPNGSDAKEIRQPRAAAVATLLPRAHVARCVIRMPPLAFIVRHVGRLLFRILSNDQMDFLAMCCRVLRVVGENERTFMAHIASTTGRRSLRAKLLRHLGHSSPGIWDPESAETRALRVAAALDADKRSGVWAAGTIVSSLPSSSTPVDHLRLAERYLEVLERVYPNACYFSAINRAHTTRFDAFNSNNAGVATVHVDAAQPQQQRRRPLLSGPSDDETKADGDRDSEAEVSSGHEWDTDSGAEESASEGQQRQHMWLGSGHQSGGIFGDAAEFGHGVQRKSRSAAATDAGANTRSARAGRRRARRRRWRRARLSDALENSNMRPNHWPTGDVDDLQTNPLYLRSFSRADVPPTGAFNPRGSLQAALVTAAQDPKTETASRENVEAAGADSCWLCQHTLQSPPPAQVSYGAEHGHCYMHVTLSWVRGWTDATRLRVLYDRWKVLPRAAGQRAQTAEFLKFARALGLFAGGGGDFATESEAALFAYNASRGNLKPVLTWARGVPLHGARVTSTGSVHVEGCANPALSALGRVVSEQALLSMPFGKGQLLEVLARRGIIQMPSTPDEGKNSAGESVKGNKDALKTLVARLARADLLFVDDSRHAATVSKSRLDLSALLPRERLSPLHTHVLRATRCAPFREAYCWHYNLRSFGPLLSPAADAGREKNSGARFYFLVRAGRLLEAGLESAHVLHKVPRSLSAVQHLFAQGHPLAALGILMNMGGVAATAEGSGASASVAMASSNSEPDGAALLQLRVLSAYVERYRELSLALFGGDAGRASAAKKSIKEIKKSADDVARSIRTHRGDLSLLELLRLSVGIEAVRPGSRPDWTINVDKVFSGLAEDQVFPSAPGRLPAGGHLPADGRQIIQRGVRWTLPHFLHPALVARGGGDEASTRLDFAHFLRQCQPLKAFHVLYAVAVEEGGAEAGRGRAEAAAAPARALECALEGLGDSRVERSCEAFLQLCGFETRPFRTVLEAAKLVADAEAVVIGVGGNTKAETVTETARTRALRLFLPLESVPSADGDGRVDVPRQHLEIARVLSRAVEARVKRSVEAKVKRSASGKEIARVSPTKGTKPPGWRCVDALVAFQVLCCQPLTVPSAAALIGHPFAPPVSDAQGFQVSARFEKLLRHADQLELPVHAVARLAHSALEAPRKAAASSAQKDVIGNFRAFSLLFLHLLLSEPARLATLAVALRRGYGRSRGDAAGDAAEKGALNFVECSANISDPSVVSCLSDECLLYMAVAMHTPSAQDTEIARLGRVASRPILAVLSTHDAGAGVAGDGHSTPTPEPRPDRDTRAEDAEKSTGQVHHEDRIDRDDRPNDEEDLYYYDGDYSEGSDAGDGGGGGSGAAVDAPTRLRRSFMSYLVAGARRFASDEISGMKYSLPAASSAVACADWVLPWLTSAGDSLRLCTAAKIFSPDSVLVDIAGAALAISSMRSADAARSLACAALKVAVRCRIPVPPEVMSAAGVPAAEASRSASGANVLLGISPAAALQLTLKFLQSQVQMVVGAAASVPGMGSASEMPRAAGSDVTLDDDYKAQHWASTRRRHGGAHPYIYIPAKPAPRPALGPAQVAAVGQALRVVWTSGVIHLLRAAAARIARPDAEEVADMSDGDGGGGGEGSTPDPDRNDKANDADDIWTNALETTEIALSFLVTISDALSRLRRAVEMRSGGAADAEIELVMLLSARPSSVEEALSSARGAFDDAASKSSRGDLRPGDREDVGDDAKQDVMGGAPAARPAAPRVAFGAALPVTSDTMFGDGIIAPSVDPVVSEALSVQAELQASFLWGFEAERMAFWRECVSEFQNARVSLRQRTIFFAQQLSVHEDTLSMDEKAFLAENLHRFDRSFRRHRSTARAAAVRRAANTSSNGAVPSSSLSIPPPMPASLRHVESNYDSVDPKSFYLMASPAPPNGLTPAAQRRRALALAHREVARVLCRSADAADQVEAEAASRGSRARGSGLFKGVRGTDVILGLGLRKRAARIADPRRHEDGKGVPVYLRRLLPPPAGSTPIGQEGGLEDLPLPRDTAIIRAALAVAAAPPGGAIPASLPQEAVRIACAQNAMLASLDGAGFSATINRSLILEELARVAWFSQATVRR